MYFEYMKKLDNEIECQLCSYKTKGVGSKARSMFYHHVETEHLNSFKSTENKNDHKSNKKDVNTNNSKKSNEDNNKTQIKRTDFWNILAAVP